MEENRNIIGMTDLLDEISRDLDDFRKKHASDYSLKSISMWWELERERILLRYKDARVARKFISRRRVWAFIIGSLMMFAAGVVKALVVR